MVKINDVRRTLEGEGRGRGAGGELHHQTGSWGEVSGSGVLLQQTTLEDPCFGSLEKPSPSFLKIASQGPTNLPLGCIP